MSRVEALIELHKGKKITHKYFLPDEFIIISGIEILTECGFKYNRRFFTVEWGKDNWEFYKE